MSVHTLDLAQTLGALPVAVVVVDETGLISYANPFARQLAPGLVAGLPLHEVFAAEERQLLAHYLQSLSSLMSSRDSRYLEGHLRAHEGHGARVAVKGRPLSKDSSGAVLSLIDITERRAREQALESLAHTDPLTGLPNRLAVLQAMKQAARTEGGCVVGLADLDRFKLINDRFGHGVGDALLVALATAWRAMLPGPAMLARLGGDEFCFVIPGPLDAAALDCLQQLRQIDVSGALPNGGEDPVTVTIGVAHSSAGSVDEVLRQCDMAMYAATRE
jgi:diguanylate cyclase (GGDEF)-like protein/PAS domain S-box-containing protein